jgi:hypothetical protein
MQTPGTYISGAAHLGLIVWLIAGWGFSSTPLDFEVADVSVVTGEQYAALVAATTPNPSDVEPDAPAAPVEEPAPAVAPVEDTPPPVAPEPVSPPAEEQAPPEAPVPPAPPEDIADTPPEIAAPSEPEQQVFAPFVSERPQPRPAERISPEPVAPPPPDVDTAPEVQDSASEEAAPDAPEVTEPETEAAPEETATEIVTEADRPSGALTTSLRPQVRQNRPAPQPEPEPAPQVAETAPDAPETSTDEDDIAAALEAATASTQEPNVPQGPPMTSSEREGFRIAVNRCWVVDPGSQAANVKVTVGFSLSQSGQVIGDIRLVGAEDGTPAGQQNAFERARRAILRCQGSGYDLPADKYGQWQEVEITFDPTGMRQL